jgi:hypothetical protein
LYVDGGNRAVAGELVHGLCSEEHTDIAGPAGYDR